MTNTDKIALGVTIPVYAIIAGPIVDMLGSAGAPGFIVTTCSACPSGTALLFASPIVGALYYLAIFFLLYGFYKIAFNLLEKAFKRMEVIHG